MREITLFETERNKKTRFGGGSFTLRIQIRFSVGIPDQDPLLFVHSSYSVAFKIMKKKNQDFSYLDLASRKIASELRSRNKFWSLGSSS
jgi:hypothetical protein